MLCLGTFDEFDETFLVAFDVGVREVSVSRRSATWFRVAVVERCVGHEGSNKGVGGAVVSGDTEGEGSGDASSSQSRLYSASMACCRSGRASTEVRTMTGSSHAEYKRPLRV